MNPRYRLMIENGADGAAGGDGGDGGGGGGGDGAAAAAARDELLGKPVTEWGDNWQEALGLDDSKLRETVLKGVKGGMPDDWRARLSEGLEGDDAKILERYTDPQAIGKALVEQRKRISEGFQPEAFPGEGTDEQKAAWREKNGVPGVADKYIEGVGEGIVIGEDDAEIMKTFAETALGSNMSQGQFDGAVKWYLGFAQEQQQALEEQDGEHRDALDEQLRNDLGTAEYKANRNNLMAVLNKTFPEEAVKALLNARLPDKKGLFNDQAIVKGLFDLARKVNPVPRLVGHGNDPGASIDARLEELSKLRKANYETFMKNDKLVKEERELIAAKQSLQAA